MSKSEFNIFSSISTKSNEKESHYLLKFINDGMQKMKESESEHQELKKKDSIILVVGGTGVGKSTLINYLNNIPLKCESQKNGNWRIDLKDQNNKLIGGFDIGHSTSDSKTLYPAIYSPNNKNFSYVDCPGFGDTRDIQGEKSSEYITMDIPNLFFRSFVTEGVKQIKIMLVITYNDLTQTLGRGALLLRSWQNLTKLFGVFDENKHLEELGNSIVIIVTQITNSVESKISEHETKKQDNIIKLQEWKKEPSITERIHKTIEKLEKKIDELTIQIQELKSQKTSTKEIIKEALRDFVCSNKTKLTANELKVISHVIDKSKIEIFSNPSRATDLKLTERDNILNLIEKETSFIDRTIANVKTVVSEEYLGMLQNLIVNGYKAFKTEISTKLSFGINNLLNKILEKAKDATDLEIIIDAIERLNTSRIQGLAAFMDNIDDSILDPKLRKKLVNQAEIIKLLINLLPEQYQQNFAYEREYLKEFNLVEYMKTVSYEINKIINNKEFEIINGQMICKGYFISSTDINNKIASSQKSLKIEEFNWIKVYTLNNFIFNSNINDELVQGVNLLIISPKWQVAENKVIINLSGATKQINEDKNNINGGKFYGVGKVFHNINNIKYISNGGEEKSNQEQQDRLLHKLDTVEERFLKAQKIYHNGMNKWYSQSTSKKEKECSNNLDKISQVGKIGLPGQALIYDTNLKLIEEPFICLLKESEKVVDDINNLQEITAVYYYHKKNIGNDLELISIGNGLQSIYITNSIKESSNNIKIAEENSTDNDNVINEQEINLWNEIEVYNNFIQKSKDELHAINLDPNFIEINQKSESDVIGDI